MREEVDKIIESIIDMSYFMRGSISYFDMYELTFAERQLIGSFLERRFEEEGKKPAHINKVY